MRKSSEPRRSGRLAIAVCSALIIAACSGSDDGGSSSEPPIDTGGESTGAIVVNPSSGGTVGAGGGPADAIDATPVGLRLSEGAPAPAGPVTVAEGTPLSDQEVAAILARLPDWDVPADDRLEFRRPAQTLPPPIVGDTIDVPFPPPTDAGPPPPPTDLPLEVLRFQPEGDVPVAPFLSVTFNQPMVPIGTLDQLDAIDVPVEMAPEIPGRWRWIGTRTLRFEVEPGLTDRLPQATEYRIEVPSGTTSASGQALDEAVVWQFATPAPTVETLSPEGDSLPLDPVFFAGFDQLVDPEAVLATISLDADGDRVLRLATDEEVTADATAARAADRALVGRWVAFRAVDDLPVDTAVTISIGPDTPSSEGPRTTEAEQRFSARTHAPLEILEHRCGWEDDCAPLMPWTIDFNNPLDPTTVTPETIAIEPELPGTVVDVYGNTISIRGASSGRTTYEVTLDATIADVFGQTLSEPKALTFDVGPARPALYAFDRQFVTLDPTSSREGVSVYTTNHDKIRVRAWAVDPGDYADYVDYLESRWSDVEPPEPAWPAVLDTTVDIDAEEDALVETFVELSDELAESGGQLVVRIDPDPPIEPEDDDYWSNQPSIAWVQSTGLGIDAIVSDRELLIWTTDLATGAPVGGVDVELLGRNETITTDSDGLARVELAPVGVRGLVATTGVETDSADISVLPAAWFDGWTERTGEDDSRWYVFDDRGIYRPGETVHLTGWTRRFTADEQQLAFVADGAEVMYRAYDPQGNELGAGSAALNDLGGFNLSFDLPEGANLGSAWVDLELVGDPSAPFAATGHGYRIEEFRTPEFEVTARPESPGPYYAARPITLAVDAQYFAGGPLPDAEVTWAVTSSTATYSPPNRDDFTFGIWQPWWWDVGGGFDGVDAEDFGLAVEGDVGIGCIDCGPGFAEPVFETFEGRTDANGTHYLQVDVEGPEPDQPTTVSAEATVFDVNRQAWAARTDELVHSSEYYVGLRSETTFVEVDEPLDIEAIVTDVDGGSVSGREITIEAGRLESAHVDGRWTESRVDVETCTVQSAVEPVTCTFATPVGGTYEVEAVVQDDDGRSNRTMFTRWVSGGDVRPARDVELEQVLIVPDAETYSPGDTAELLVSAPFAPASGLITVTRGGIESTQVVDAPDGSVVVSVPIVDSDIPGLGVQIDMTGSAERAGDDGTPLPDAPRRPAFATGRIDLSIPPVSRTLTVTAVPETAALEPGVDTSVTIEVGDASGSPVAGADVAVVVVDEAVLALTGYELADPLDVFYRPIRSEISTEYARSTIVLDRPDRTGADGGEEARADADLGGTVSSGAPAATEESLAVDDAEAPAEGRSSGADGAAPITLRSDFDPVAVYAPSESTGPDGTVTIDVPLPDNLTRYRVMAVAVDGVDRFGTGESTITARLPLMVRPSAPRFLNFGDRLELPVVVQNQTGSTVEVDVALEAANLTLTEAAGYRVTVPANDRVEVRFPSAAEEAGTARIRVAAVDGEAADAAEVQLPVYTPATTEAFATSGVLDDGTIAQPVLPPGDVWPQFGGLEINTSSTALQTLTDAVLYLSEYRYEHADGLASRIIAVAALRDVLDAFDSAEMPSPEEIEAAMRRDIDRLAALQNDDGGWPTWRRGEPSYPFVSVSSAHALVSADLEGYEVPDHTLDAALVYLADIESHIPDHYGERVRDTLSAYALHVRNLAGDRDTAKAQALYDRAGDDLGLDALAWLWPVLDDPTADAEIERTFLNGAVETAGAATFAVDYGEDAYLLAYSDRRTDGIILDALISERPDSDLIPKVVAGLLGNQVQGRWNNAYENSFILLAMNNYFDTFESITPDFVARVWLGDSYVAEHEYRGRTTDRATSLLPMSELVAADTTEEQDLIVAKDGEGRLYYRLGTKYAPTDLDLDPRDEGFVVDRVYEAVDDPDDVVLGDDGVWRIEPGATVRVRLTMVADARRTNIALVDPLPAGLEPLNPSLDVSTTPRPDDSPTADESYWCWCWTWYDHVNLRDDRAEAFAAWLGAGVYEYTYEARATTPGEFVVPPARAEEIYAPEVFGRSASARVSIS
ncbi:MAG: alpha-2-macroglobulin family protein [Acidimicrobiia bacterium]|nr:alpha-2-macroglobulin family protein [Acidimicrobiia bacterium]